MSTPKYIRNAGKPWTPGEVSILKELAQNNTPTRIIGLKLGRPVAGIRTQATKQHISLNPPNRSPYNRRSQKK